MTQNTASLIVVGNLPDKTNFTFANSIKGAKIKFGYGSEIKRVVILDTEASIEASDDRSKVIRNILGPACQIVSVPCLDDFRVQAFQTLADELKRKSVQVLIVDITNGRRNETFDLIVATSICRISNVIMTSVPRESLSLPYWELQDEKYSINTIKPFSQDRSLESAAQFELVYYADRIKECVKVIRESRGSSIVGYADNIERTLTNAIMNYFSDDPENFDNALKRLSELHEAIARRLDKEVSGGKSEGSFANFVERIQKQLSRPAIDSAKEDDVVDEDRLAAVILGDLLGFCQKYRNYLAHPHHRSIELSDVRLMIFTTFTILEKTAAIVSWLDRSGGNNVSSN